MLDPGLGKTKRAYLWLYRSSATAEQQMAIYDFHASQAWHSCTALFTRLCGQLNGG